MGWGAWLNADLFKLFWDLNLLFFCWFFSPVGDLGLSFAFCWWHCGSMMEHCDVNLGGNIGLRDWNIKMCEK